MPTKMNIEKALKEMPCDLPLFIDIDTASQLIGVSDTHIRNLCRSGKVNKAIKVGNVWRINRDAFFNQFGLSYE